MSNSCSSPQSTVTSVTDAVHEQREVVSEESVTSEVESVCKIRSMPLCKIHDASRSRFKARRIAGRSCRLHTMSRPAPIRSVSKRLFDAPTPGEIDAFLSEAEQGSHDSFKDRYNFDIVNELPLPGRYEWVKVHP